METEYKIGDYYLIIDESRPDEGWQATKSLGYGRFETVDIFLGPDEIVIGPRIDPPPLPKKENPPKGVEAADALMAIFGYKRVETKGNEIRYKSV